ncbi:AMP-binding protein [Mobilicoccus pelagius]|uniref:Putative non-ribosomal peptide synthetase n=1 Tax=Mobilicoccus pelagius NBRC 104925 TaxID=1089455 RepID=H5UR83_9MICO|nr:AMP-binding protein [Mobilicoccus pelagius]GAB48241.1 putative non-ribosomal peptide synthetase [Mobilicoccus pelagius NBRC 104925]
MTHISRSVRLAPLTATDATSGVVDRFATVLEALADEPAVIDADGTYTYTRLAAEAASVRASILAGTSPGEPVAVLHPHRCTAVAAILGVIASGHPLLVLDYRTPAPRLQQMCERVDARAVVAAGDLLDLAAELGRPVIGPDALTATDTATLFEGPVDPNGTAVLAFTSGSTGVPKVVLNSGRMLVSDAWRNSAATDCYDADDVIAHTLPMAFHAGLMVTVAGLVVGSTMRLFDTRARGIAGLAPWIDQVGATIMHTSPAILRAFVSSGPTPQQLTTLRTVTIAGEPAHGRDVEQIRPLLPPTCLLRNRYGSSETGLIAEYVVDADHPPLSGPLPVGRPVGNTEIRCLAEDGTPLAAGESGIVAVTRDVVANGYLGNPEATALAFFDEPDGRRTYRTSDVGEVDDEGLRLLGRRDHSVKIRGYMVEPGEVDAALFALPDVTEALTVGVKSDTGERYRLVSYVVSSADRPSAAAVRSVLREHLPGHLVPEAVVFLDALPRTERGKLDRAALPAPPPPDVGERVRSEWERLVAQVWARALGLDEVGRDADFFALGGDSLAAEEVTAMVVSDLGIDPGDVTSAFLVQAPTVAEYARRLKRRPDRRQQILTVLRPGPNEGTTQARRTPLFLVAGGGGLGLGFVPVVRHLPDDQPVYAFHSYGLERKAVPDWSVEAAARRNLRELRRIQAHGPYRVAGHSFGGLVALEMCQQLRAAGEEVEILFVLDSFPPDPALIPDAPTGRSLARRARDVAGLLVTGLVPTPGLGQYWRFHEQSRVLSKRYRTPPYPGRTVVLVAESEDKEARASWDAHLSGEWVRLETPGDHITMMRDPYAETLADHLTRCLAALDAGAGPPPAPGAGPDTGGTTSSGASRVSEVGEAPADDLTPLRREAEVSAARTVA